MSDTTDQVAELERQLGESHAALDVLRQAHADAWTLLGRCDLAFEEIARSKSLSGTRRLAAQLREEIQKASEQK